MYRSALVMDISLHYTFLYPRIQVPRSKRKARNPSRVFYLFFDVGPRPRRIRVPSRTSWGPSPASRSGTGKSGTRSSLERGTELCTEFPRLYRKPQSPFLGRVSNNCLAIDNLPGRHRFRSSTILGNHANPRVHGPSPTPTHKWISKKHSTQVWLR